MRFYVRKYYYRKNAEYKSFNFIDEEVEVGTVFADLNLDIENGLEYLQFFKTDKTKDKTSFVEYERSRVKLSGRYFIGKEMVMDKIKTTNTEMYNNILTRFNVENNTTIVFTKHNYYIKGKNDIVVYPNEIINNKYNVLEANV